MIYKEGHKINRIRIGDNKEVYRVYFNDQIVFKRYHPVTAVVASTHDQWIETDIKDIWTDDLTWEVSFSVNVNSTCILGCRPDKGFQEYGFIASDSTNDHYLFRAGGLTVGSSSPDAVKATGPLLLSNATYPFDTLSSTAGKTSGIIYDIRKIETVKFTGNKLYINEKEYPFTEQSGYPFFLTYLPIHFFRYNQIDFTGGIDNSNGTRYLYYARFWRKGKIYRDFIPVLDENGVAALYEKVTKKFFYSAGSKPLEYFNNNFSPINCLYGFSTTAYIDTKILPKDIGKWEIRLQYNSTNTLSNNVRYGFGCMRSDYSGFYFGNTPSTDASIKNKYIIKIGNQTINTNISINTIDEVNISIDMINKKVQINNQTFSITDTSSLDDLPSLIIGALRNNNTISGQMPNMYFYESKIYNKEGQLVQCLKPHLDREQDIAISYDILNKEPYYSAKTGKFSFI